MKKTDLYLKPGTYIKSSTTQGDVQGISLENFVVSVLNNPTCCAKPVFIKNGMLMTTNYLSGSLQSVLDQGSNTSPLQLSTQLVRIESNLEVAERLNIESDSTVTTQVSSVIRSTTTNASLVLAPNGTGALVAAIPDGTATGGNARGQYSVDLQTYRTNANQVASGLLNGILSGSRHRTLGEGSVIAGGDLNIASNNGATVSGGYNHTASGQYSNVSGGFGNNATSNYSVVSGGQSNTASTNTHATVVGGLSNTSSGQYGVSGGFANVVSGNLSVAFGWQNQVAGGAAFSFGNQNSSMQDRSGTFGGYALSYITGQISQANGRFSITGDSQISNIVARNTASLTSASTLILYADGVSSVIRPDGLNRAWNVQVNWVAVVTTITGTATGISVGDVITSIDLLAFKRVGGTSSASAHTSTATKTMVTTPAAYAACAINYTAGASQEMALTFTGPSFAGGGSVTMRVVARIELSEVAW
jgi:hypothetical protein